MNLPPLWKVKRELTRVGASMWRGGRGIFFEPIRQWLYDSSTVRRECKINGCKDLSGRVVIFVIFQPKGLAESVKFTLDHLVAEGWSIVVVSNAPLSAADTCVVTHRAAKLLVRPNVGYDFGGYRAGLRLLAELEHGPEHLVLMNDSVWFPLRENDDTLRRMEALRAAMTGHIFKNEAKKGQDHLESHLLMVSRECLAHPAWVRFWDRFLMSDDRVTTIRRGEKGLSQALICAGLQVEGLISRDSFIRCLEQLEETELRGVMSDVLHHRADAQKQFEALSKNKTWRADFLEWVREVLANSRQHLISTTFIAPAVELCSMCFVKKAQDQRFHLARQKILELQSDGRIAPLNPIVKIEIYKAVEDWVAVRE